MFLFVFSLAVVSDRIATDFNKPGATWAVTVDIFKTFNRICHAFLLHKVKSYGISSRISGFISSFFNNRRLEVVLTRGVCKTAQLFLVFLKLLFIVLNSFYINDLHDDVICNNALYVDDTAIYPKCDHVSDFLQQLELASELNSDRLDIEGWEMKWLIHFIGWRNSTCFVWPVWQLWYY